MLQQGLDFRCKGEQPAVVVVVKRLFPEAVAGAKQPARLRVPQREREHAAEPLDAGRPILLVGVQDGLCVAMRRVPVPGPFQLRPQIRMIENLAVIDDLQPAVFVGHRLLPGRQIDDA